jgi:ribosomal protein S18 acetylase RimI-like enzyme
MVMQDEAIAAYVQHVDLSRAVLIGAVDEASGGVLGLAEAQPALTPNRVEMAVSVHAAYRRCGLGQRLLRQALLKAFACGAEAAEFIFSPENRPILGLARKRGARVATTFDCAELLCTR